MPPGDLERQGLESLVFCLWSGAASFHKDFWVYDVNRVQSIEFIIRHPNPGKNSLLCPLMSAIKTSGGPNFMNDLYDLPDN